MTDRAADDFETIRRRMGEIVGEGEPIVAVDRKALLDYVKRLWPLLGDDSVFTYIESRELKYLGETENEAGEKCSNYAVELPLPRIPLLAFSFDLQSDQNTEPSPNDIESQPQ